MIEFLAQILEQALQLMVIGLGFTIQQFVDRYSSSVFLGLPQMANQTVKDPYSKSQLLTCFGVMFRP